MNAKRQQPARGRPVALTVVNLRISCQDCNQPIARPSSGTETWSAEEYARHAIDSKGRGRCPHCGAAIAFGRVFLATIPETKTKGPDQC